MRPRRPLRALWIAWAVIALAVAIPLALARGHPPGFIFVPFVAVAWLVGHLVILAVGSLARRLAVSRPEVVAAGARLAPRWIGGALVGAAFLGATGALLFMAGSIVVQHERVGALGALLIAVMLGVWTLLGLVLAGLAAGRGWAITALRWTVAAGGLGCAWMVVGGALDGRPVIAAIGLVGLAVTGWLVVALGPARVK